MLDRQTEIPEAKACTSAPCVWSVPQSLDRTEKPPLADLTIKTPDAVRHSKNKASPNDPESSRKRRKGIKSTLYEARVSQARSFDMEKFKVLSDNLKKCNSNSHASSVFNTMSQEEAETRFGKVPLGSVLSVQCLLLPASFNVYCNIKQCDTSQQFAFIDYPSFPLIENPEIINNNLKNVSDDKKLKILNDLKITRGDVSLIEERTRDQSENQHWFKLHQNRFTASMNNILHQKDPKTPRGFKTLANNLIVGDKKLTQIRSSNINYLTESFMSL